MPQLIRVLLLCFLVVSSIDLFAQYDWKEGSSGRYKYKYVTNDPTQTRFYTLSNGLQFIASVNKKEPRIQTLFAVRAGSNTDPATNTGLAHYLEHLLFKGTDKFGTQDWEKEKPMLDQIESLYEDYNSTTDETKRKEIYRQIDKISGEAVKYSVPNEYAKMMKEMGGQATNAHTWYEETVYEDDIPTTSIEKFLALQEERFRNPIFRLFHTELEAVYEEKNRTLDNDGRKIIYAFMESLFPTHNYGLQTTIGTIDHLKNPSLTEIRKYYEKYYVPNNMALIFAGDFDPDRVVGQVDAAFSFMKSKPLTEYNPPAQAPLTASITKHVYGPSAESVTIAFRVPGARDSRATLLSILIDELLFNGRAGLVDLNVVKKQVILTASSELHRYKDYAIPQLIGSPKEGQSMDQVRDILLEQLTLLKKGEFDESLIKAIANKFKLSELQGLDFNSNRAGDLMESYIQTKGNDWREKVSLVSDMSKVTKQDIVEFANKHYQYYVAVYKHKGEDKSIVKVDKPSITPLTLNSQQTSEFAKRIGSMPAGKAMPEWLDYGKDVSKGKIGNLDVLYKQNSDNDIFRVYYRFDLGISNNKQVPLATSYLQYLGTKEKTADQVSTEFFKLGSNFSINSGQEITTMTLTGLRENMDKTVSLFEELVRNCVADEKALSDLKSRAIKSRADAKLNRQVINQALQNYAQYGAKNPFNNVLTKDELNGVTSASLVNLIHSLFDYNHKIIFYGKPTMKEFVSIMEPIHQTTGTFKPTPEFTTFAPRVLDRSQVLYFDYDMVQAEISWIRNPGVYGASNTPVIDLYNQYFGLGMSSVVFQTIRESKALAYSSYCVMITPDRKDKYYTLLGYVGTQADKIGEAIPAMNELLVSLPFSEKSFTSARENLKNDIETQRFYQDGVIFSYLLAQRRGLDYDQRKNTYAAIDKLTFKDLEKFHNEWISNKPVTYCVLGSEKKLPLADLSKYGEVKKLTPEELFGY